MWYSSIIFLAAGLAYSYWLGFTPPLLGVVYLFASLISYYLYSKDKKAARNGEWRVPENTLHLSALLGGWPGSIIGQFKLGHKTKKVSFRMVFWTTILINVSLLSWLHTPKGAQIFHNYVYDVNYWVVSQFGNDIGAILLELTKFNPSR